MIQRLKPFRKDNHVTGSTEDREQLIVDLLLHEYDALRAEILARTTSRFQLLGFAAVAVSVLAATTIGGVWKGILIAIIVVAAAAIWLRFGRYTDRCAARIRGIEATINFEVHAHALWWETNRPSVSFVETIIFWKHMSDPIKVDPADYPPRTPSSQE